MGHTKPSDLKDLQKILDEVREWEFIKEKSANVFYFKALPFLHFHDKDGARWADVRKGDGWQKLEIGFAAKLPEHKRFLKSVRVSYEKLLKT